MISPLCKDVPTGDVLQLVDHHRSDAVQRAGITVIPGTKQLR